eukprot:4822579-Pleurochrysis_carterae.AAC.4
MCEEAGKHGESALCCVCTIVRAIVCARAAAAIRSQTHRAQQRCMHSSAPAMARRGGAEASKVAETGVTA